MIHDDSLCFKCFKRCWLKGQEVMERDLIKEFVNESNLSHTLSNMQTHTCPFNWSTTIFVIVLYNSCLFDMSVFVVDEKMARASIVCVYAHFCSQLPELGKGIKKKKTELEGLMRASDKSLIAFTHKVSSIVSALLYHEVFTTIFCLKNLWWATTLSSFISRVT